MSLSVQLGSDDNFPSERFTSDQASRAELYISLNTWDENWEESSSSDDSEVSTALHVAYARLQNPADSSAKNSYFAIRVFGTDDQDAVFLWFDDSIVPCYDKEDRCEISVRFDETVCETFLIEKAADCGGAVVLDSDKLIRILLDASKYEISLPLEGGSLLDIVLDLSEPLWWPRYDSKIDAA